MKKKNSQPKCPTCGIAGATHPISKKKEDYGYCWKHFPSGWKPKTEQASQPGHTCGSWPDAFGTPEDWRKKAIAMKSCPACSGEKKTEKSLGYISSECGYCNVEEKHIRFEDYIIRHQNCRKAFLKGMEYAKLIKKKTISN